MGHFAVHAVVRPTLVLYVPHAQFVHDGWPVRLWYFPAAQSVQLHEPDEPAYVPMGQFKHAEAPAFEYLPVPHLLVHAVFFAVLVLYVPQAQ
jgi:hypothetical protein